MNSLFYTSLVLMGKGMLAIFVVILIIFMVLLFLGKKRKKQDSK